MNCWPNGYLFDVLGMAGISLQLAVQTQKIAAGREIRHNLVENHLRLFVARFGETVCKIFPSLFIELICLHRLQRFGNLHWKVGHSHTFEFVWCFAERFTVSNFASVASTTLLSKPTEAT